MIQLQALTKRKSLYEEYFLWCYSRRRNSEKVFDNRDHRVVLRGGLVAICWRQEYSCRKAIETDFEMRAGLIDQCTYVKKWDEYSSGLSMMLATNSRALLSCNGRKRRATLARNVCWNMRRHNLHFSPYRATAKLKS